MDFCRERDWFAGLMLMFALFVLRLAAALAGAGQAPKATLSVPIKKLAEYYMTDPISRSSPTMAQCVKAVSEMRG
jgi:hypothetical protein